MLACAEIACVYWSEQPERGVRMPEDCFEWVLKLDRRGIWLIVAALLQHFSAKAEGRAYGKRAHSAECLRSGSIFVQ